MWDREVVLKRRIVITTTRCVITQKSAVLVYFAAEACNHACTFISSLDDPSDRITLLDCLDFRDFS